MKLLNIKYKLAQAMKKIVIELTDRQFEDIMKHFRRQNEVNAKEDHFLMKQEVFHRYRLMKCVMNI